MTPTSVEEIERQHQEAIRLLDEGLQCSASIDGQIPLLYKDRPTSHLTHLPTSSTFAEEKKQPTEHESFYPCWTSRGSVDVTAIQALVREGYDHESSAPGDGSRRAYKAADVRSRSNMWEEANAAVHNVRICRPSHDTWGIKKVVLVFCDDFLQNVYHMPWWNRSDIQQAIRPVLQVLSIHQSQVVRLLLASLPPGVTIPVHHDTGEWVKHTHRVHVPVLVRNPQNVLFRCGLTVDDLQRIDCTPGHVFEINNQAKHAVSNCDSDHRVHLILDYVEPDFQMPRVVQLSPGEVLLQTRRSIDRLCDRGTRPTPSFFILGAQKAGTTSLYEYMVQHPLIVRARRRETHCLDWRWNDELKTTEQQRDWCHKFYFQQELDLHPSCLTGDSTPSYLLDSSRVIPRLMKVFPWRVKFFVMLRDPVRRAESHYAMVTSLEGTEAQLKARGMEWRNKSIRQVIEKELSFMEACGLIPYFNIASGTVDEVLFEAFSGTVEENEAWTRYLEKIPLHTGSHCLLGRGLYELNLRPWLASFDVSDFLILRLEDMNEPFGVDRVMHRVWQHLCVPPIRLKDSSAKNQRDYKSVLDEELSAYLYRFFAPHDRKLEFVVRSLQDNHN